MKQPARVYGRMLAVVLTLAARVAFGESAVVLTTVASNTSPLLPCRVHLADAAGKPVKAPGLPFWRDHFVCDGEVRLKLAPGQYTYAIERGPEYHAATGAFNVVEGQALSLTNALRRLANLAAEGWWSGETHVHRPPQDLELLMRAEDLHVAPLTTWWNNQNLWANRPLPAPPLVRFDGDRYYYWLGGEDERGGGALLYFNLPAPLEVAGAQREYPPSTKFLRAARQIRLPDGAANAPVWVDIEKPFWWDTPIWLASGLVDSVGICHNHMHRGGMLDNEAWGRGRDRQKYPPAWGNGLWTQDIYYHILNCGLRLPPSAGSASGVLPNPVGYNRAYVRLDGELTYEKWWQGLRAGRVFVSNGPLLRCRADGQWPGHVFKGNRPLQIRLDGQVDSRDPLAAVELVRNGQVERIRLPNTISMNESGWFLLRAIADVTNTFRFASTGPWYVEIGDRPPPVRRASAQFFLDWVRERATNVSAALSNAAQRDEALQPVREAEKFWQDKVAQAARTTTMTGEIRDAATGQLLPARVYIQGAGGRWLFPQSASPQGSAIRYEKRNWLNTNAVEYHTTLSAHPFRLDLEPGVYTITVERGKEYRHLVQRVEVGDEPLHVRLSLLRWINLASRGWYSGDTHVHRSLVDLPNVMLAEDVNVVFPLTYWVTKAFAPPTQGDKNTDAGKDAALIAVDKTHVIWPRNTEYEIFTVNGKSHTLGAVFALGHRTPFNVGAPPVKPLAQQARREGALLDLDKHDWPWSMALVPLLPVDLYELANNHHWRTEFGITNWSTRAPASMNLPNAGRHGTERDWTLYTFQNYYALLDCGFRLRPTAGTANGVHPVPLGYGRVYVHLPGGFSYEAWLKGLNAGRSFVTTGPMLLAETTKSRVSGTVLSEQPVNEVEVIVNGVVRDHLKLQPAQNAEGAWESRFRQALKLDGTSWVALRCWESRANNRIRFAHTAPQWFDVAKRPLQPRREEVDFLIGRVRDQIERSRELLPPEALAEYQQALEIYERIKPLSPPPGGSRSSPGSAARP